mmetsp:Transcript_9146/g.26345  ORF Transcript_9146/g.26345 Transcript_9146/m.26345 type:complete len:92 (+) Transcript_9146:417-692(+)
MVRCVRGKRGLGLFFPIGCSGGLAGAGLCCAVSEEGKCHLRVSGRSPLMHGVFPHTDSVCERWAKDTKRHRQAGRQAGRQKIRERPAPMSC